MGGRAIMLAAVAVQAVAGFLPWLRTGERERNGFELVDAARTLEALDSVIVRTLALALYFVPLAATACWLAVLLEWRRTATGLALATGLLGVIVAFSIERAPVLSLSGVRATLIAAVAVIGGATVDLLERRTT